MDRPRKDKSIERLQSALSVIDQLKQLPMSSPQFKKWLRDTEVAISNTFGDKPKYARDFTDIRYIPVVIYSGMSDSHYQGFYVRGLESAASAIESMIDEIREYWADDDQPISAPSAGPNGPEITDEVFVVHGSDHGAKDAVARFLTKLGLEPIVLHEHPNQGRTIIEKFEQYAKVGFAVVLLTPDDSCADTHQPGSSRPRPRQNVILELGFFLGKLGRDRTCALMKGDVEIPSDYNGIVYIPMDNEAWKLKLVRELKQAGLDVDANLAL